MSSHGVVTMLDAEPRTARAIVLHQPNERLRADAGRGLGHLRLARKVFHELRDVLGAFAQGRKLEDHLREPEVQVASKRSRVDLALQLASCRGDDSHVDGPIRVGTDRLDLSSCRKRRSFG